MEGGKCSRHVHVSDAHHVLNEIMISLLPRQMMPCRQRPPANYPGSGESSFRAWDGATKDHTWERLTSDKWLWSSASPSTAAPASPSGLLFDIL